jgi:hypothetical protein
LEARAQVYVRFLNRSKTTILIVNLPNEKNNDTESNYGVIGVSEGATGALGVQRNEREKPDKSRRRKGREQLLLLRRRSPRHDQRRRKRHGELCVIAGEPFKGMVEKGEIRTIVYKSMIKFPPFPPIVFSVTTSRLHNNQPHVVVKDCIKLYPLWHCADRWSNTQKSVYLKQTPDQYAAICF